MGEIEMSEKEKCLVCGRLYPESHYIYDIGDTVSVDIINGSMIIRRVCHKCLRNKKAEGK